MLQGNKGSLSSPSAFFLPQAHSYNECLFCPAVLLLFLHRRSIGSVLKVSTGVLSSDQTTGLVHYQVLSYSIGSNLSIKTQLLFLAPDPNKQVHPFPIYIPYVMNVSYTFTNELHFASQLTLLWKLQNTEAVVSVLTGRGKMEARSFHRHYNSPWASWGVLGGASVTTFQSYLSYFKTVEPILPLYWGARRQ